MIHNTVVWILGSEIILNLKSNKLRFWTDIYIPRAVMIGSYLSCTIMSICKSCENRFFLICGNSHRVRFLHIIFYKILAEIRPAPWCILKKIAAVILLYDVSFYMIRWYRIENWSRCTVSAFLQCLWGTTSSRVFIQCANRVS